MTTLLGPASTPLRVSENSISNFPFSLTDFMYKIQEVGNHSLKGCVSIEKQKFTEKNPYKKIKR
jgi:hypothetical protein